MQNAELRARGYNIEASNQRAEAGLATMKGQQAATAGTLEASVRYLVALRLSLING
jgi:hypothetical protein